MSDQQSTVKVDYVFGADTTDLEKAQAAQRALVDALKRTREESDRMRQQTKSSAEASYDAWRAEKARIDGLIAMADKVDLVAEEQEKYERQLQKVKQSETERLSALQRQNEYIERGAQGITQLTTAIGAVNPKLAEFVSHANAGVMGLASMGKDAISFSKATNGMEKGLAGLGLATSAISVGLQAAAIAIAEIDRRADAYVAGAQRRHFEGAKVTATQQRQLNEMIARGAYEYDHTKSLGDNFNLMLQKQRDAAREAKEEMQQLARSQADNTLAGERLAKEGLEPELDVLARGSDLYELLIDLTKRYGVEVARQRIGPAVDKWMESYKSLDLAQRKVVEDSLHSLVMVGQETAKAADGWASLWDAASHKVAATTIQATSVIKDAWGNLKEVNLIEGLSTDMKELAAGTSLVKDAWGNLKAVNLVSTLKDNAEAIADEGEAAEDAADSKERLTDAEHGIADSADLATEAATGSGDALRDWFEGGQSSEGGVPPGVSMGADGVLYDQSGGIWLGGTGETSGGGGSGIRHSSSPTSRPSMPSPGFGGFASRDATYQQDMLSSDPARRKAASGRLYAKQQGDIAAFQAQYGHNGGPALEGFGGSLAGAVGDAESGVDMGSGEGWDPSAEGGDIGMARALVGGLDSAGLERGPGGIYSGAEGIGRARGEMAGNEGAPLQALMSMMLREHSSLREALSGGI